MASNSKQKVLKYHEYGENGRFGILCQTHHTEGTYPLHRHNYIEFEVLVGGELWHELNGIRYTAQKGACWCLDTEDIHSIAVEQPITLHNVCVDRNEAPAAIRQFLDAITFSRVGQFPSAVLPQVEQLFESLSAAIADRSPYAKERVTGCVLLLISLFAEYSEAFKLQPSAVGYPRVAEAVRYITEHYHEPITLSEVAAAVYLTPSYFSKVFVEKVGYTFSEYVTYLRLERAKKLLTETAMPITVIAFRCGFATFSSFSRQFRGYCGCTPTAYRKGI